MGMIKAAIRRARRRLEPDYDWGRMSVETMDRKEEVNTYQFELDWFGFIFGIHIGRRRTPRP